MATTSRERGWARDYAAMLFISDLVAVTAAVFIAQLLRWGVTLDASLEAFRGAELTISYYTVSGLLILAWIGVLGLFRSRDARFAGSGSTEYVLVVRASLWLFGVAAIIFFALQVPIARAYVLIALPYGLVLVLLGRWLLRNRLVRQRQSGADVSFRAMVVGTEHSVRRVLADLRREPWAGYNVVAAVIPGSALRVIGDGDVPVTSEVSSILDELELHAADTLIVTSSDQLSADEVRRVSWGLEPGRQHLIMVPDLVDVAGPRIHTRPVAGLQLMHVETPRFTGPQLFAKRSFDLIASALLIVVLSPLLLVAAILVKVTSPGPVFFRQERVGYQGARFRMWKFRSMVSDAEARLEQLESRNESGGATFKLRDDPRITTVGRFLRRYSIDELPQLFNVFGGSMSLVGPRPHPPRDVERYEAHVHRRFLVKPGITGPWQVGGRSDLSWEESVRLDLYYVENWSFFGDLIYLWRTLRAVLARDGAY